MADLKGLLSSLVNIDGINAVVVVSRDGFVIEGATKSGEVDTEAMGAVISTAVGSSQMIGNELQVGTMDHSFVEYSNGILMMSLIGAEAILAVTADLKANLGNIRYQVKKAIPDIKKFL